MEDDDIPPPESLLPYDRWTNEALRLVVLRAVEHAAREGMPGGHHFYITFRTDFPGVTMPDRLRERYPEEMTIVLQHQYRDLSVDEAARCISVTLSFSGIPSTLIIPLDAVTGFVDPEIHFGLQFLPPDTEASPEPTPQPEPESESPEPVDSAAPVVSLDAFRRRTPPKS